MKYIIDSVPKLYDMTSEEVEKVKLSKELSEDNEEFILRYYITKARKLIGKLLQVDVTTDPLINKCDLAQRITGSVLSNNGITVKPVTSGELLGNNVPGHSFLIATINGHDYIIDIDYRQFFTEEGCDIDNVMFYNDVIVKTPDLGFYVKHISSIDESTAKKIIEDGFVKLTDHTAKDYMDGFYFCQPGNVRFADIGGNVYINALRKSNEDYSTNYDYIEEIYGIKCDEGSVR